MQDKEILEAFLKTSTGQKTAKKIKNLVKENEELKKNKTFLQSRIHELEEILNNSNISSFTKDDEIIARELMSNVEESAYKGNKVNKYLFSIADENENEIRIYSNKFHKILEDETYK